MNKKYCLFTDIDLDGAGAEYLFKKAFNKDDTHYTIIHDRFINENVQNIIKNESYKEYSIIFIVDVSISVETAEMINELEDNNFILLDHHKQSLSHQKFDWAYVAVYENYVNILKKWIKLKYQKILNELNIKNKNIEDSFRLILNEAFINSLAFEDDNKLIEIAKDIFDKDICNFYKIDKLSVYDESKITENSCKACGTSLLYKYLSITNLLELDIEKNEIVEYIRLYDTYEWKEALFEIGYYSKLLNNNLSFYGMDEFIRRLIYIPNILHSSKFTFPHDCIESKEKKYVEVFSKREKLIFETIYFNDKPIKIAITFAENYTNALGNYIMETYQDEIDACAIVKLSNKSIEYRGNGKIDLSELAISKGGGGHFNASGHPLSEGIINMIIAKLFH